ncbi:MAG: TetR family transcriptional regulator [Actinomycetota bacterium]|nr:TetR family transcriptional regulator [Actinomycetota bacterium]
MSAHTAEKIRDADRSREAILETAERLFAQFGYDGASLSEIGADAGLSRGTPSYYFGSKEDLYIAVLDRAFTARQAATQAAFEPVHGWCRGTEGLDALRIALAHAADRYLRFLVEHPSFVQLVMREELAGGSRMRARTALSTALEDAFGALRRAGRQRGLRPFSVGDATVLFVALTFAPVSYRNTFMTAMNRNLTQPAGRREQVKLAVDQLMHLLAASDG